MGNDMKKEKKYEQVINSMKQDFEKWNLQAHERFLTDKEAMARYGGSRVTIRRAFSQLEQEGYIYRVRGKGTLVGPNPGQISRIIAFLGERLDRNGVEHLLINGIEDHLFDNNSSLLIANMENEPERAKAYIERFARQGIDGVVFFPMLAPPEQNIEIVRLLQKKKIPFVLVGRLLRVLQDELNYVISDDFDGGYKITQHLLSLGHRRIAFYRSIDLDNCTSLVARREGYLAALREAGIEPDPELDQQSSITTMSFLIKRWRMLSDPPTAVFVDNDATLSLFMESARAQGMKVPDDISVAGFDDLIRISTLIHHTTINVPYYELGQTAATQLYHVMDGKITRPQHTVLPVSLKIRQTTGINPNFQEKAPATP
jgi:GntR family transcriptional regulator of arabinose operon